jgi:protein SHQ1
LHAEAEKHDWQFLQTVHDESNIRLSAEVPYGFLNRYTGYFVNVLSKENEVNELGGDAETLDPQERRRRRKKHEDDKWDEEHYMYVGSCYFQAPLNVRQRGFYG